MDDEGDQASERARARWAVRLRVVRTYTNEYPKGAVVQQRRAARDFFSVTARSVGEKLEKFSGPISNPQLSA
jgi:hypothetical protein